MNKDYYLKNKEKISKQKKIYNSRPDIKINRKKYYKEYCEKNKESLACFRKNKWQKIKNDEVLLKEHRKYHSEYYQAHRNENVKKVKEDRKKRWQETKKDPEKMAKTKTQIKRWRATPSGMYTSLKNRKRKDFDLSKEDFIDWFNKQDKKCDYCGLTLKQINNLPYPYNRKNGLNKFSIDRTDSSKGYTINNITLCCFTCNTIKNNLLSYDDMKKIGEEILKPKFKKIRFNLK